MEDYSKEREEVKKLFGNRQLPNEPRFTKEGDLYEKNLPRGKVEPKQILEMVRRGYDPLNIKEVLLYELARDEGKLIDRKFKWPELTDNQIKQIEDLEKECGNNPLAYGAALEDLLMSFLPENTTRSHDEKVNKFVDHIQNDPPVYFQNNKTFNEKTKEKDEKVFKLIKGIKWEEVIEEINILDPWQPIKAYAFEDEKFIYRLLIYKSIQHPEAEEPGTIMELPENQFELTLVIKELNNPKVFTDSKIYSREELKNFFNFIL
jgi:hypothetical protein